MNGDFQHAYFPVSLNLDGRLAVVVGGGPVIEPHVRALLRYGADVLVIASDVPPSLDELVAQGLIEHDAREYVRGDLAGAFIVISDGASIETARAVYQEAEGNGCLVTCIRAPELSNFSMPAVVERGLMQVAVSTAGASPEVAMGVRDELEDQFGPEWELYAALLGEVRHMILERISDNSRRKYYFDALAATDIRERLVRGQTVAAEDVYQDIVFGLEDGED